MYNRTNNVRRTYSYMTQTVREDMTNKNRGTTRLTRLKRLVINKIGNWRTTKVGG